jgi:hypothetical protein
VTLGSSQENAAPSSKQIEETETALVRDLLHQDGYSESDPFSSSCVPLHHSEAMQGVPMHDKLGRPASVCADGLAIDASLAPKPKTKEAQFDVVVDMDLHHK